MTTTTAFELRGEEEEGEGEEEPRTITGKKKGGGGEEGSLESCSYNKGKSFFSSFLGL